MKRLILLSFALFAFSTAGYGQWATLDFGSGPGGAYTTSVSSPLYDQIGTANNAGSWSEDFQDPSWDSSDNQTADDFIVPAGDPWVIRQIEVIGGRNGTPPHSEGPFDIFIYNDNGNSPGTVAHQILNINPTSFHPSGAADYGSFLFDVTPFQLTSGKYWLSAVADVEFVAASELWFWDTVLNFGVFNTQSHLRNPGNGTGVNCIDWQPSDICNLTGTNDDYDVQFAIGGNVLPVELTRFDALVSGTDVILQWETLTETNNAGFEIEMRGLSENADELYRTLDFVPGAGTTLEAQQYTYRITNLEPGRYTFRLKQVDYDGAFEYSPDVEALVAVPDQFVLEPAYPNPFNPSTTLRFAVAEQQPVTVVLYDALGVAVRTLFSGVAPGNQMQSVQVDGANLASGLYMVRLEAGGFQATQAVILHK